jgi:hypothetical protein
LSLSLSVNRCFRARFVTEKSIADKNKKGILFRKNVNAVTARQVLLM